MIKHDLVIGGIYQHYSAKQYKILQVGYYFNKKTGVELEPVVVYQALYNDKNLGNNTIFIRPLEEFTKPLKDNSPRYIKISSYTHKISPK